ncbi:MAG: putative transposase [Candidatus Argoarchaeum ethanivorans]|uniref:Putative transposase n=1 Tax=Candidatus Argoarchaeum ethanivorans TaxID=2608793 RepID=A0A811T6U9_9EURY|nr:MAG: putative transposase [Candidatus Argoarchaeum ethanivorans]
MQMVYKFRLYPTSEQEQFLLFVMEVCRWVYNHFLSIWNSVAKIPGRYDLQATLPQLKDDNPNLKKVNSKTLQMVLFMLYNNLKVLRELKKKGRKVGRLRYRKYGRFKSFILNQSGFKLKITDNRLDKLYVSKVGDIPIRLHQKIDGVIKQVIIKKYQSGKWYALICTEKDAQPKNQMPRSFIGLDMGLLHFLTDTAGRQIENPKFYKQTLKLIKIGQRKLSRKKKGSKNRLKQKLRLNRLYDKLTHQRDDFLHKLSRYYVDTYDLISVEDLNVTNMVKNHKLSQSILDSSWSKFFYMLSYKAESAGKILIKVNPKNTSKECSICGSMQDMPLSERIYNCSECGIVIDRDVNAAINILRRGIIRQGLPFTLPETAPLQSLLQVSASSVVEGRSHLR